MKLNPDCVRAILLAVEETVDSTQIFEYSITEPKNPRLVKYDHNEILYHFRQCSMAGLIIGFQPLESGDSVIIEYLSPEGHQFLANIRQDTIWNNTKTIATQIGSKSLDTLIQISASIITERIKIRFGLS